MLGGTTKHYKTYGKHKTNVVNKRVILDNNKRLSPLATSTNNKVKSGGWSDDSIDSSDEEVELVPTVSKKVVNVEKKVVPKASTRRSNEIIEQDKENSSPASSIKTASSSKSKGKSVEVVVLESTEESSDSAKRVPLRKKSARKVPVRSKFSRVVESEAELSDRPIEEKAEEETDDVVIVEERRNEIYLDNTDEPIPSEDETETLIGSSAPPTVLLSALPFPPTLAPLLAATLSPDSIAPFDFTSFVSSPLAPFSVPSTLEHPWRKVGEASYSEVFSTTSGGGEEIVIKIIPIASPDKEEDEEQTTVGIPFLSEWEAVKREIEISHLLGAENGGIEGFVPFKGAYLVQGAYPASLLASWDAFKAAQKPACDDQIRPSTLPPSQLYALILLSHAGTDLESWKVRNWREAKEIWEQVVEQLGAAEESCEFEHRDLHWGNILIAPSSSSSSSSSAALPEQFASLQLTPRKQSLPSPSTRPTIKATLIDFTLSRLVRASTTTPTRSRSKGKAKANPNVLYDGFEDECIFEGEGDRQFDVYRGMKEIVEREGGGWEAFHPKTNLLWLHYLVDKLLHAKKLKTPSLPPSPSALSNSSPFSSPSRSVPSPRKTRRHSLLISSLSSPLPIERKSRTLPSSSALLGKSKMLNERQRKDMIDEVAAWECLIKAEEKLREVLGDLIEEERVVKKSVRKNTVKSRKAVRGGKKSTEAAEEQEGLRGAADFAKWSRDRRE